MAEKSAAEVAAAIEEAKKKLSAKQKKETAALVERTEAEKAPPKKFPRVEAKQRTDYIKIGLRLLEKRFPELQKNLKRANMPMDAPKFIAQTLIVATIFALGGGVLFAVLATTLSLPLLLTLLVIPLVFAAVFLWVIQYPKVKIKAREKDLDRDVLFAGRDMLIAIKSGVPLFNAMANVSRNYGVASEEFGKIVERIQSGVPAEIAMQESSDMNTSKPFRQILLQMVTSMRSGADMALALEIVLSQISQEQVIALKRYGQTLNPITMFYMLFGIILPSLGIAIGIILTSFINIKIDFNMLLIVLFLLGVLQYIFLAMMSSSRPNFEV